MKQYVFLIDADNTLFPVGANKIPKETLNAIKSARQKGHIFVICTGRGLHDVRNIKGAKEFDYIAALTGTEIYDIKRKAIIQSPQPFNQDSVKRLVKYCADKGYGWTYKTINSENSIFKFGKEALFSAKNVSCRRFEHDLLKDEILQMLVNCKVGKKMANLFPEFRFINMPGDYADVLNKDVSKAKGVEFFRKMLPKAKIVAVGDAENDVGMFEAADISIAMGNATKSVKEKADFVTKSVQENGVIYAINDTINGSMLKSKKRRS